MIKFWGWIATRRLLYWTALTVVLLGFVGSFIWHYSWWPFAALFALSLLSTFSGVSRNVPNGEEENSGARHPQENDPNRR